MLRESLIKVFYGQEQHFRWRGKEVTRIENLSDAVFAFSIALIVMSSSVPTSIHDLMSSMRLVPAFGVCFLFLWMLWTHHYIFFRRYGLADSATLVMNAVLMFLVLIYVYPLRFLFAYLFDGLWYFSGVLPKEYHDEIGLRLEGAVTIGQSAAMMVIYSAGYAAVSLTFAWMYRHALRRANDLELNARELVLTRHGLRSHYLYASVAFLSILVASLGKPELAGWLYFLMCPLGITQGVLLQRAMKRFPATGA